MATPVKKPWAILLCRYSDDGNDPNVTTISNLAAQWRATKGTDFINGNLSAAWDTDNRTILDLYQTFFTIVGLFTFNVVRYFDEMSHGLLDVTGNQVFPITIDLTTAEATALANVPGGKKYQDDMFARAKKKLNDVYGVDWKTFTGGVAVSFQSPDFGSQGGTFDGGPGAYVDIRYVKNNGTQWWGHEMSHGFGLDHSRTDGEFTSNCTGGAPSDYTDPFDIMSIACANSDVDTNYGLHGPGMNAWNMRKLGGIDESRIWKGSASASFSEVVVLRPLHWRNSPGYLAAEVPGIAGDSTYLIEFRVPQFWDSAIGQPVVIIHRFDGQHSYVMKSSNNHKGLVAGDYFDKGAGPRIRIQVISIDAVNMSATVRLCYSLAPVGRKSVTIHYGSGILRRPCTPNKPVAGEIGTFSFSVQNVFCHLSHRASWTVQGASPAPGGSNTGDTFSIVTPDPSVSVVVIVTVTFEDGESIVSYYPFKSISAEDASWFEFICNLTLHGERLKPIPWWEWDREKLTHILETFSEKEIALVRERTERISRTLGDLLKGR
ncbi:MAG: hypothetical protein ABUM51_09555 [Bacteroidota bacterium]